MRFLDRHCATGAFNVSMPSRLGQTTTQDARADFVESAPPPDILGGGEMGARFRAILENSSTIIYIKDAQGRYLQVNRRFEELFDVTQDRVVGKDDYEIFGQKAGESYRANDAVVFQTGKPIEAEETSVRPDGVHTYISIKFPLRAADGSIYGLAGIATDITQRKRDDQAARRLAAIVDSSDDAIVGKDLNGIINSWNQGAERIFGYRAEEVIGRPITILIPPERQDEEERILAKIRSGERVDHFETIRQRKDGSRLEISLTISPVKDSSGQIIGASKIARDITERKRAERQQLALYQLVTAVNRANALPEIFTAALDAICTCHNVSRASILLADAEGVMRFKAWRGLSDRYRRSVEGHSPWRRDEPAPQPVCVENVAQAPLAAELRQVIEDEGIGALSFIPMSSEQQLLGKFMIYYDQPHRFTADEIRSAQTIASQVIFALERRRSREELEQLVNQRTASLREAIGQMEEFSYSVSHDLRSPVRAMRGYAQALLEDYGERLDKEGQEYLRRITQSGERMERLIHDVLTYSRLSRMEMDIQPIALGELIREVMRQYPELDPAKADFIIPEHLPRVMGHEPSLGQAVANLLNNAVKFTRPGVRPVIRIETRQAAGRVQLRIQDNGIGIRPDQQHKLFAMFERIHPNAAYEGTGIGLAIVRRTVERMGGNVGVESDGEHGSTFWIELPQAKPT